MKNSEILAGILAVAVVVLLTIVVAPPTRADESSNAFGSLSPFVENRGQIDPSILFYSENDWGRLCVREQDLVFQLSDGRRVQNVYLDLPEGRFSSPRGEGSPVASLNYFIGADSSKWLTGVPVFEKLRMDGFIGSLPLLISAEGNAEGLLTVSGEPLTGNLIRLRAASEEAKSFIKKMLRDRADSGAASSRDESQTMEWATYLGGSKEDRANDIARDSSGNVYLAGSSESSNIPVPGGYDQSLNSASYADIYVAKLSAGGSQLLWATYIGGDVEDSAYAIALDSFGNVVIGGKATKNTPAPGGYLTSYDGTGIYVAKLSPAGSSLLWGTFITGGVCCDIILDSSDNVVAASETTKNNAPCPGGYDSTYNGGSSDLHIAKLSSSGSQLMWGTYLGGAGDDALDDDSIGAPMISLAWAKDGGIVVGTSTQSTAIPTTGGFDTSHNGSWDMYVAKLTESGAGLSWGTYLGGSKEDWFGDLEVDQSGNIVVVGASRSLNMPVQGGYQMTHNTDSYYDGYAAKISSSGNSLVWGTYLGGSKDDFLRSCAIDAYGNVLLAGETNSSDMPVENPYDQTWNGSADIYFGVLNPDGSDLLEGSFVGGTKTDSTRSAIFDGTDSMIFAGWSCSDDMPTLNAYDPSLNNATCGNYGTYDIYAAKFSLSSVAGCLISCSATVPVFASPNESVSFLALGTADPAGCATPSYEWDFGDGSAHSNSQNTAHTYTAENSYNWTLKVSADGVEDCLKSGTITVTSSQCRITCEASSQQTGLINVASAFTASSTAEGCTQAVSYLWDFGDGQTSTSQNPSHTYATAGTYGWTMTASADSMECSASGTIEILAERPCLVVGNLNFCADMITQSGSTYTLAGNVSINGILFFTNNVEYTKSSTTGGSLFTLGDIYVPNVHGSDETLVKGPNVGYFVDGWNMKFIPSSVPPNYSLSLANLPLEIEGTEMIIESGGVKLRPYINLGVAPLIIARVQAELLVVPNGEKTLVSMEVVTGDIVPSLSISSFSVTYDPETETITGSASIGLPFLEIASLDATVEFIPGCLNGFSIKVGLPVGIPLGPSGLEIDALILEVDDICTPADLRLFLGGDIAIAEVPSELIVIEHVGLAYQVPFTLEIDGGSVAFLGFPLSSMGGTITVYPPYLSVYGDTNIAGVYTTHISLTLDISNLVISGSAYGSIQIPDWSCDSLACYAVKALVESVISLPYTFAGAGMDVSAGQVEPGKWGGRLRGSVTAMDETVAVEIAFLNGDTSLSVGTNYDNLYEIWLREEKMLSPLGFEKTLTLPKEEEQVVFSAASTTTLPEIYLQTPTGERLTRDNYTTYPGVSFVESAKNKVTFFKVKPAAAGDWAFGTTNLGQGEAELFALGAHPIPAVIFESVTPDSKGYSVKLKLEPADADTKVSLYYTDSPDFGEGIAITKDLKSGNGNYTVSWQTANVPNGNYMIFAKADDGKNPAEAVYYSSQVSVNKDAIQPPTALSGSILQDGAHLSWIPSVSEGASGYYVLYTDEPEVLGYKFRWSSALSGSALVTGLDASKSYRFAVVAYDNEGNFSLESNSVTLSFLPPPVITSMTKLGSPFRINVAGSNLQQGIKVYINGTLWPTVTWKTTSNIKIKGGSALKLLVPKGVDTEFKFQNPDGGEATSTWRY